MKSYIIQSFFPFSIVCLEIHPHGNIYHYFTVFYCRVTSYAMAIPHFICSPNDEHLDCFRLGAIMKWNNECYAVIICLQASVWIWGFDSLECTLRSGHVVDFTSEDTAPPFSEVASHPQSLSVFSVLLITASLVAAWASHYGFIWHCSND